MSKDTEIEVRVEVDLLLSQFRTNLEDYADITDEREFEDLLRDEIEASAYNNISVHILNLESVIEAWRKLKKI